MAWIQNMSIPKSNKLEFNISNFTGGLNNRSNIIEDNQASDLLNMKFVAGDIMEKRNGYKPIDDFKLDKPITHLDMYKPYADADQLIRATDSEVYANRRKIADVHGTIDGVNFQGYYVFADGTDLYAYGYFPESTGIYTKIIGSHPKDYVTLTVVNPPSDYEPLGDLHFQGVTVYDYENMTVHYEPCANELDDTYLQANLLPENPRFVEVFKGRLFVSGDDKDDDNIYITDLRNPFYFPVALPVQLPPNSDRVRGMRVYDNAVIIGRENDMYKLTGETNNPELGFELHTLTKLNTHTGVANNKAWSVAHNYLFFLGGDGVAYALGTTHMDTRLLATRILSENLDLFKYPIGATDETLQTASSVFDSEFWYVNIGDVTLVYSYRHRAWTLYNQVDMNAPLFVDNKLMWGRKDGIVAEFGDEYHDNGTPIYAFWKSKVFDMDRPSNYKQFREFFIVCQTYDYTDSDVRVNFEIDYSDVKGTALIENKLALWGKAKFGDRFITRNINTSVPFMIGRRARNLRVQVSNGYFYKGNVDTFIGLYDVPNKFNYMCIFVEDEQKYYYYENGRWLEVTPEKGNQPMCVYQINGEYEVKGKR